jgi:cell wall-associated NlpC family hydrolase
MRRPAYTGSLDLGYRSPVAAPIGEEMRRALVIVCAAALAAAAVAGAQSGGRSWAHPQIAAVVSAGLMAPSVAEFRPQDVLTAGELAIALSALGEAGVTVDDLDRPVTMRELDARLVALVGLSREARAIRLRAARAGLSPTPWLGTETVARLLGLRINHPVDREWLERQLDEPATRAEAAYSIARLLSLEPADVEALRATLATFELPELDQAQQAVLRRALRFVGSPYVWAGSSERAQQVGGRTVPGGFDCSGFVWRVYKLQPFGFAPRLSTVLQGRTSYAMSAEIAPAARIARSDLLPGDVVFFGSAGPRSRPAQVGHMGIYVGGGWFVHSSSNGTTLQPLAGWHDRTFAWARRPLAEAGVALEPAERAAGGGVPKRS